MLILHAIEYNNVPIAPIVAIFEKEDGMIGRSPQNSNHLFLPDDQERLVKLRHAEIRVESDRYYIVPLAGCFIDIGSQKLVEGNRQELKDEDTINIGLYKIRVEIVSYSKLREHFIKGLDIDPTSCTLTLNSELMYCVGRLVRSFSRGTLDLYDIRNEMRKATNGHGATDVGRLLQSPDKLVELEIGSNSSPNVIDRVFDELKDHHHRLVSTLDELASIIETTIHDAKTRTNENVFEVLGKFNHSYVVETVIPRLYRGESAITKNHGLGSD